MSVGRERIESHAVSITPVSWLTTSDEISINACDTNGI